MQNAEACRLEEQSLNPSEFSMINGTPWASDREARHLSMCKTDLLPYIICLLEPPQKQNKKLSTRSPHRTMVRIKQEE